MAKPDVMDFARLIVSGDLEALSRRLSADTTLARAPATIGASRKDAPTYFLREIAHYVYEGDTPLHWAAAAFLRPVCRLLVEHGAKCRAKNRRGAEPLHYAADTNHWEPAAQVETIEYLLSIGADPNSLDQDGVAPIHRAVRTRSMPAVVALLKGGAEPMIRNGSGSTPLHLAVQTTGRGGSGSEHAREQQARIIQVLLERGASPDDEDERGKRVSQLAKSEGIRALLRGESGPGGTS